MKIGVYKRLVSALSFTLMLTTVPAKADITKVPVSRGGMDGCDMKLIDQQTSPGYESTFREQLQAQLNNAGVSWSSCYRSKEIQQQTCQEKCHQDSCPSPHNCAPPGQSNHQKVATADISGLPGDATAHCNFLFQVCQKMRAQNSQLGCEIGAYNTGSNHLAVGPGISNSAYNQCSFLRSQMGLPPPPTGDPLKKEGDDLMKEITGAAGPLAKAAQAGAQLAQAMNQGGSGSGSSPSSTSTDPSPVSGAPSGSGENGSPPQSSSGGSGQSSSGPAGPRVAFNVATPGGAGSAAVGAPAARRDGSYGSDISNRSDNGTGASSAGGGGSTRASGASPAGTASSGPAGAAGASPSPGVAGTRTGGTDASDEYLMSFAGGFKFGGGSSAGGAKPGAPADGGDNAVVNSALDQAEKAADRAPSSEQPADGDGNAGESLFFRHHEAINRCLMSGCVTPKE